MEQIIQTESWLAWIYYKLGFKLGKSSYVFLVQWLGIEAGNHADKWSEWEWETELLGDLVHCPKYVRYITL